jgi:hypothetical protein
MGKKNKKRRRVSNLDRKASSDIAAKALSNKNEAEASVADEDEAKQASNVHGETTTATRELSPRCKNKDSTSGGSARKRKRSGKAMSEKGTFGRCSIESRE